MNSNKTQSILIYFIWGIILSSLIGCSENNSNFNYTRKLVLQDSLKLEIDSLINPMTHNMQHIDWKDKDLLAYASECDLIFFDLDEKSIFKKIKYEKNGPNGIGKVRGFHFHNFDSIFITSGMPWNVIITNSAAQVTDRIKLDHLKIDKLNPALLSPSNTALINRVIKKENEFFFSIYLAGKSNPDFSETPVGVICNFSNNKYKVGPFNFPKFGKQRKNFNPPRFSRDCDKEKWVYSYIYHHNLYIRNFDENKYRHINAKSKLAKKDNLLYEKCQGYDLLYKVATEPRYMSIIYDPWREVFYRLFYPGIEVSSDNKENDYYSIIENPRNFSVIILNKDLKVIGETEMPQNTYDPKTHFVNEDGLHFGLSARNPDFDPDYLKFARFTVEKLNNDNQ